MSTQLQSAHPFHGISLHVTIVVAPENTDKFLEHMKPCFDAVTAEPECMSFQVFHDPEQPGYFRFVENWSKDKEWLIKVGLVFVSSSKLRRRRTLMVVLALEVMVLMWGRQYQLTKDYYKPYEEATKPLWIKPRELRVFEQLDDGWTMVKASSKDGALT